jgi:hypothetical protein
MTVAPNGSNKSAAGRVPEKRIDGVSGDVLSLGIALRRSTAYAYAYLRYCCGNSYGSCSLIDAYGVTFDGLVEVFEDSFMLLWVGMSHFEASELVFK